MRKLWLAGAALAVTSCGAARDTEGAEAQVAAFHRAYNAGRHGPLWDRAAPAMKEITPKPQFLDLMAQLRERLGAVEATKQTGWNVNYATGGSQVTLTYQTTFANGEGTETFIYDTGKPPRLMGWHVVSPVLLGSAPGPAELEKAD